MKDIKIPGFVWVILIAAAIVFCENYLANPLYGEIAVAVLLGAAKAANLGTKELEEVLALLRRFQAESPPLAGARGEVAVPRVDVKALEPNKTVRWLLG